MQLQLPALKRQWRLRRKICKISIMKMIVSILISVLLIFEFIPIAVITQAVPLITAELRIPDIDFGVYESLNVLIDEKTTRLDSPEILAETQAVLDEVPLENDTFGIPITAETYTMREHPPTKITEHMPTIFEELPAQKPKWLIEQDSILDFLLYSWPPVASYVIYTNYHGHKKWTNDSIRYAIVDDLRPGAYIDVDDNHNTGIKDNPYTLFINETGADVWVRLIGLPTVEDLPSELRDLLTLRNLQNLTLAELLELDLELPENFTTMGGLRVEIRNLVTNVTLPLEIAILKAIAYDHQNAIWCVSFNFTDTPTEFTVELYTEHLTLNAVLDIIGNRPNIVLDLGAIRGPFILHYAQNLDTDALRGAVGIAKFEAREIVEWSWLQLQLLRASGLDTIPRTATMRLHIEEFMAPCDRVIWDAPLPVSAILEYYEERINLTYGKLVLLDVPTHLDIAVNYTVADNGKNLTILTYEANGRVKLLEFIEFEFPGYSKTTPNLADFRKVYLKATNLPTQLYIEATSEINRNLTITLSNDPRLSLVARIIDNIVILVATRIHRIGRILRELPENFMTLPGRQGWVILEAFNNEYFSQIELYRTSGNYIWLPPHKNNDFMAMFNDTETQQREISTHYDLVNISVSGRISNVKYALLSFRDNKTKLEYELVPGGQPFQAFFIDNKNYAYVRLSNLPSWIVLDVEQNKFSYNAIEPTVQSAWSDTTTISELKFQSQILEQYLELTIKDIPQNITMVKSGRRISINANNYLGEIVFKVANNTNAQLKTIAGNFMYCCFNSTYTTASGRITGIQKLVYEPGIEGVMELSLNTQKPLQLVLIDELNYSYSRMVIRPLPANFRMSLPGILNTSIVRFPDIVNVSGIIDFSNVIFSLANFGKSLINVMQVISKNIIESIGSLAIDFSFSYKLEPLGYEFLNLDIIAEVSIGSPSILATLPQISWTHGLCLSQRELNGQLALQTKIYLQGLPREGNITSKLGKDRRSLYLQVEFYDYAPRYDWLLIDTRGVQARDIMVYITGLTPHIDLYAELNLTFDVVDRKPELNCKLNFESSVDLGQIYIVINRHEPPDRSRVELYLEKLPSEIVLSVNLKDAITMEYEASMPLKFAYFKLSRLIGTDWKRMYGIFHDIPTYVNLRVSRSMEFDLDAPLYLQGLPAITLVSSAKELDMYINIEGEVLGQRGDFELYFENVADTVNCYSKRDTYRVRAATNIGFVWLSAKDLPMTTKFTLHKLDLRASQLRAAEIKITMLFGVYPIFSFTRLDGGWLKLSLDSSYKLFGNEQPATIVLSDFAFDRVIVGTPAFTNGVMINLDAYETHKIVPEPITTIEATLML